MRDSTNPFLFDVMDLTRKLQSAGYQTDIDSNRILHWKINPTPEQVLLAQAIADGYEALTITVDAPSIVADGVAIATINCNDALIASDALLSYTVYGSDGVIEIQGTIDVVAGAASYPFKTRIKDKYVIELARVSRLETGTIIVEAI